LFLLLEAIADVIQTVAFPGLGTGVGRIGFNTCARQMRSAIEEVILEQYSFPRSWTEAQARHQKLYTDASEICKSTLKQ
jgi:O-acetyl-ADP-ribose deacetylase (regulator of RNase III)